MRLILSVLFTLAFTLPLHAKVDPLDVGKSKDPNDNKGLGLGAKGTISDLYSANDNYVKQPETNGKAEETVYHLPDADERDQRPLQNQNGTSSEDATER